MPRYQNSNFVLQNVLRNLYTVGRQDDFQEVLHTKDIIPRYMRVPGQTLLRIF